MPKASPSSSRRVTASDLRILPSLGCDVEAHVLALVDVTEAAQHEVGGDVADSAARDVAVLDGDDGVRQLPRCRGARPRSLGPNISARPWTSGSSACMRASSGCLTKRPSCRAGVKRLPKAVGAGPGHLVYTARAGACQKKWWALSRLVGGGRCRQDGRASGSLRGGWAGLSACRDCESVGARGGGRTRRRRRAAPPASVRIQRFARPVAPGWPAPRRSCRRARRSASPCRPASSWRG